MNGINNKTIIFQECKKSFVDINSNCAFINLTDTDNDIFILVHELAHFIDRNHNPKIIPDEYWFFSETFSFYIEKKFEIWLNNKEYEHLISKRRNNRMYFESKMLKAISNLLYYEDLYKSKGKLEEKDIDVKKVKTIMRYDIPYNIVNYLLQYPLANILSTELLNSNIKFDKDFVQIVLDMNLYEILRKYNNIQKPEFMLK